MAFWQDMLGTLWGAAKTVLPRCSCGAPSLPVACIECGKPCCEQHAWINIATMRVICSSCIAQCDGSWSNAPQQTRRARQPKQPPRREPKAAAPRVDDPWRVLGIRQTDDEGEVQRAFRRQAKKHHPDHGGDPQAFVRLNRARDEALRRIRENG